MDIPSSVHGCKICGRAIMKEHEKCQECIKAVAREIVEVLEDMHQSLGYGEQIIKVFPDGKKIDLEKWIWERRNKYAKIAKEGV